MGQRHFGAETRAEPSPQSGQRVGKAGPTWHFPALWWLSGRGPTASLGAAEARQQGLGAEPVVTTD